MMPDTSTNTWYKNVHEISMGNAKTLAKLEVVYLSSGSYNKATGITFAM